MDLAEFLLDPFFGPPPPFFFLNYANKLAAPNVSNETLTEREVLTQFIWGL